MDWSLSSLEWKSKSSKLKSAPLIKHWANSVALRVIRSTWQRSFELGILTTTLKLWQSRVKYIYCWSAVDNHTQKCNGILLITNDNSTMSGSRIMWVLWFMLNVILITCKGELKYISSFCDCKESYHNLASATIYRRRLQMNVAANRKKKKNVVASTRCSWFFMQSCSVSCCPPWLGKKRL